LLFYVISGVLRLLAGPGDTLIAAILGFLGLVSVAYAGYLGGDMVFSKGTGVNHTAWEAGGDDYEAVLAVDAVKENTLHRVEVAGVPVVLLKQGENFYAISATCPHAGGPLDEGTLTGDQVECPWHGSRFCLRDGRVLTGPAVVNAPRYDVRVTNGQVTLKRLGEH
jgi:nitrite reductase/ring-hydroxylating ferredoxin subunit